MNDKRSFMSIALIAIMLCALCAVCVSTNVSADAAGTISYGPSICYQNDGSSDRVVISGVTPYHQHSSGTWHNLGGAATSEAAVVSVSNGRVDVFVRGNDGNIWWQTSTNNGDSWTGWRKPSGYGDLKVLAGTAIAVCKEPGIDNRFVLFWVDATSGALKTVWYNVNGGNWYALQNLGGVCTSTPAAVVTAPNRLHAFVRGTDGAIWHRFTTGGWSEWTSLGEYLYQPAGSTTGYGPAVSARDGQNNIFDVFWVDSNRNLEYKRLDPDQYLVRQNLGGMCTSPPSAGYSGPTVFMWTEVRGSDNLIWGRRATLSDPNALATFASWSGPYKGPVT